MGRSEAWDASGDLGGETGALVDVDESAAAASAAAEANADACAVRGVVRAVGARADDATHAAPCARCGGIDDERDAWRSGEAWIRVAGAAIAGGAERGAD